jgi:hypothetical protein
MERLRVGHPKKRLLSFVAQDVDDGVRSDVRHLIARLVTSRAWSLAQPRFTHEIVWPGRESRGDSPVETLGGDLDIYSALPPKLDWRQLDDLTAILNALVVFARSKAVNLQFDLSGAIIGMVKVGEMDRQLSEEFPGTWTRRLRHSP